MTGNYQSQIQYYDSSVIWESVEGGNYFVLCMGFRSSQGHFSIVVTEVDAPGNDDCSNATLIDPSGDIVEGSTILAKYDENLKYCGTATNKTSGGVWFTFPGTGGTLSLGVAGLFDTQVSLYKGANCGKLVCVDGNDESQVASFSSTLIVTTIVNETYYVLGKSSET